MTPRVFLAAPLLFILAGGTASAAAPGMAPGMPPEVLSKREIVLAGDEYRDLAHRWRSYLDEHPASAVACVQLARALRYTGAPEEETRALILRGREIDPDEPQVLQALAVTAFPERTRLVTPDESIRLAERAAALAPEWSEPHFTLCNTGLVVGRPELTRRHARILADAGAIPPPLLDYGRNMLASADSSAIVITNGDNDTFPCLVAGVGQGFRTDVTIVEHWSLNVLSCARAAFPSNGDGPGPFADGEIDALHDRLERGELGSERSFDSVVRAALLEKVQGGSWTKPVYFALTIDPSCLAECDLPLEIEGLLYRVRSGLATEGETPLAYEKTASLLRGGFRLTSATDPAFPWSPATAFRPLMMNYAHLLHAVALEAEARDDAPTARRFSERAITIARFHDREDIVERFEEEGGK